VEGSFLLAAARGRPRADWSSPGSDTPSAFGIAGFTPEPGCRVTVAGGRARSWSKGQRALTAVELMVVLAVIAILGLAAYPWLANFREVLLVKGAAEQTAAAIRTARQFAITQGSNYCIEFNTGQYRIRQADTSPACNGATVSGYDWQALSQSGTIVTTAPTMAFDPIGNRILPTGVANTVFNVDTSPSACLSTITVTLYGGVRVAGC
jgi:prepilin-type N-terminal cleavage/methylation domain-containing protein